MAQIYDQIGAGYAQTRKSDPRIAAAIQGALGSAQSVLNVGAGTGSYEPTGVDVVAVEPSATMTAQRPPGSAPVVRASAMDLPFGDNVFAAAMAVLTMHHWPDRERGLGEMNRVARDGCVIVTYDAESAGFWLVRDYFPQFLETDRRTMPRMDELRQALGPIRILELPIPHDCTDGFLGAYWRRPERYLDERIRRGISSFANHEAVAPGLARLREDVESGVWQTEHKDILTRSELDIGYRIVVSGSLATG